MHDWGMASDEAEFWRRRHEVVGVSGNCSQPDGGRRFVLLVDVTDRGLRAAYEPLRRRLGEFDCLAPTPPDGLHVTVKTLDLGVDGGGSEAGVVDRVGEAVAAAAADCEPFETRLPQLNVFPDVVYAEVGSGTTLSRLNERLCAAAPTRTLDRDGGGFIPHLTLGYFTGDEDADALVEFLEAERELSLPTLRVKEVTLASYEVTDRGHPDYEVVETYPLGG